MPNWTTACPDWEARILDGTSLVPFDPLFPAEAASALEVFWDLRIVDAPGSPTMREACRTWVFDFVAAVFGAYDAETGRRLIRNFFMLVSKKNSKSTIAAGIMLTALIRNWRLSAEYLILAPTIEVANNSFKPAFDMVRSNAELGALLHPNFATRTITHRNTGAILKVVAADKDTVGGKKAVGVLVDELWLFGKRSNAENMLREATGGLASRPEGFIIYLTTQSDEPPAGVFKQKLREFRDIRDGKIVNPRSLGVLYEFPETMLKAQAYKDPANFYVTNPNLGKSVDEEFLLDELTAAERAGQDSLRGFLAKHLNVEIGLALRADRWVGADLWEARGDKNLTLEAILLRSEVIVIGIDGGGQDDLLAMAVLGRDRMTREWLAWGHAWAAEIALDRRKSEASRLRDFERDGDLTIVADMQVAFDDLAGRARQIEDTGLLAVIGIDPSGVGLIVDALAAVGIEGDDRVKGVYQDRPLQGAIKTVEVKLAGGTLIHCAQPLMAWAVSNAKIEQKTNYIMVTKAASGTAKIDPLMALFDAADRMGKNPEPMGSVYTAHRGLVVFG